MRGEFGGVAAVFVVRGGGGGVVSAFFGRVRGLE